MHGMGETKHQSFFFCLFQMLHVGPLIYSQNNSQETRSGTIDLPVISRFNLFHSIQTDALSGQVRP